MVNFLCMNLSYWLSAVFIQMSNSELKHWFYKSKKWSNGSVKQPRSQGSLLLIEKPWERVWSVSLFTQLFTQDHKINLVPRRSRCGQSWTLPWAVTSSQTSHGQRVKRERLGTRLSQNEAIFTLFLDSFCACAKTIPDRASVLTQDFGANSVMCL